jgi:hypothetical protein
MMDNIIVNMIADKTIRATIKAVAKPVNWKNGQMTKQRNGQNCHRVCVPLCNRQMNGLCNKVIAFGHCRLSNRKTDSICVCKTIRMIIRAIMRKTIRIYRQLTAVTAISITK